jgi:hypothetical protein
MKFQGSVGKTTYTIEDQPDGRFVRLHRFNSNTRESAEFFVPVSLVIEYMVARIAPRLGRVLMGEL